MNNLKPHEEPLKDYRFATREEVEEANRLSGLIPNSELPFNENGERNDKVY
jgi:hypothetical protein